MMRPPGKWYRLIEGIVATIVLFYLVHNVLMAGSGRWGPRDEDGLPIRPASTGKEATAPACGR